MRSAPRQTPDMSADTPALNGTLPLIRTLDAMRICRSRDAAGSALSFRTLDPMRRDAALHAVTLRSAVLPRFDGSRAAAGVRGRSLCARLSGSSTGALIADLHRKNGD